MYTTAAPQRPLVVLLAALVANRKVFGAPASIGLARALAVTMTTTTTSTSNTSLRVGYHAWSPYSSSAAAPAEASTTAAAATAAAEARAALRAALRAVDAHLTSVAGNRQWRDYVLEQAREVAAADAARGRGEKGGGREQGAARQQGAGEEAASSAAAAARDYAFLLSNVARHRALLREYNIGVDPDERNRQMVEKTAARVGFSIPRPQEEDEEGEGGSEGGSGQRPSIAQRAAMARRAAAAAATAPSSSSPTAAGGAPSKD
jgi:hypothetical protein